MAGTFTTTGTISNLTRIELEQLRRVDFFSNGKALTIGDSALLPDGVIGLGDLNAEPYRSGPTIRLDDIYSAVIPNNPGPGISTLTSLGAVVSETVRWYGPTYVFDGDAGYALSATVWRDDTPALNFTLSVMVGDILLIKPNDGASGDDNENAVGTVSVVAANTLTLTFIANPDGGPNLDFGASTEFNYVIVRPQAVQLFAVPGSGPLGSEQTFLAVSPTSTLHSNPAPDSGTIALDRVRDIVVPTTNLNADRADAVYPTPRGGGLERIGYRVVLYPDDGTGLAPDLTSPILSLSPLINTVIPVTDQRMEIDYKAGIIRFSCAPDIGGDIKVAGGVNPTTGRLSLYAVFWSVDTSLTAGSARKLHAVRSTDSTARVPGEIHYDTTTNVWRVGATVDDNEFFVDARSDAETPLRLTRFGVFDNVTTGSDPRRYFAYRADPTVREISLWGVNGWTMREGPPNDFDPLVNTEVRVGAKHDISVGDGSNPPQSLGDFNPSAIEYGYRTGVAAALEVALKRTATNGYGTLHLRRGKYYTNDLVYVPPGVTIQGEGAGTVLQSYGGTALAINYPVFRFGPNTPNGVYDFDYGGGLYSASPEFSWTGTLEGFDVVWNPTRRVWGVIQGDPVTQAIYFNEITPSGVALYPGVGVDIKQSADALLTNLSTNGTNHSGSHSPRIAHHWRSDEYSVVWVEEYSPGGILGPRVGYNAVLVNNLTHVATRKFGSTIYPATGNTYKDHPSVAVDQRSLALYGVALCYWSYTAAIAVSSFIAVIVNSTVPTTIYFSGPLPLSAKNVVSSTDVDDDEAGNFLFVFCVRPHPIYYRTATGSTVAGTATLTDLGAAFVTNGVKIGSRYIQLTPGNADSGRSGVIFSVTATALEIRFDDVPNDDFNVTSGAVSYAVAPSSVIATLYFDAATLVFQGPVEVAGRAGIALNPYQPAEREPDFPKVKHGGGQWLIAYQNFDTNAYLAKNVIANFDNNLNTAFIDQAFGVARGLGAVRQHLSTCFVILGPQGTLTAPSTTAFDFDNSVSNILVAANATSVTARSLGGRVLPGPYPNLMNLFSTALYGNINENRLEMEVSARNYSALWGSISPSLIPDVTWSGSDWVVVSPTVAHILSDTGTYIQVGPTPYLADPTFYFGSALPSVDGHFLHRTIDLGVDSIYFPSLGVSRTIIGVSSEHVVELSATVGLASGTSLVPWVLVRDSSSWNTQAGIKNAGYRVSPKGEVIVATNFFTFADPVPDTGLFGNTVPRVTELLSRRIWGDSTYTGDYLTGTLPRYGAVFQSWNDLIPTSRISADVTFRGVAVGAPKGMGANHLTEQPMVAVAWGENFFGCLERNKAGSNSLTGFFRQSFGPWKSGLKDLALVSTVPSRAAASPTSLRVLTKEHVYTRHGYITGGQPYFDTDGYRNMFSFVGTPTIGAAYPFGNNQEIGVLAEESAYRKNINAVYTDAVGRDPITHRGPPILFQESPRELKNTQGTSGGAVAIRGAGIQVTDAAAPKVVWDGKRFAVFTATMFQRTAPVDGGSFSPVDYLWPKTRGVLNMVLFPGDEGVGYMNEALIGNLAMNTGSLTANIGANSPKIVATSMITCGTNNDWDLRELTVIDIAYSGKVYCVVWSIGYNVAGTPGTNWLGGSAVGYTLFPNLEGTSDLGLSPNPTGVPSFVIESISSGLPGVSSDLSLTKARFLNPKVIWDGKKFFIVYQVLSDTDGTLDNGKFMLCIAVDEEGPGSHTTHIKAIAANQNRLATSIFGGTTRYGGTLATNTAGELYLGRAYNATSAGGILTRVFAIPESPWSNIQCAVGDIVEITGLLPDSGSADVTTKYNGHYPVVDYVTHPVGGAVIDINCAFEVGVLNFRVYGKIYSGGLATNPGDFTDGAHTSGPNTRALILKNPWITDLFTPSAHTSITQAQFVTRIWGVVYNETLEEYVILAECQLTAVAATRRLRLFAVKKATMDIRAERDISFTVGVETIPAALSWNGAYYLVVYGTGFATVTGQDIHAVLVGPNLIEEIADQLVADYSEVIGNTGRTMPGPGYGAIVGTLQVYPNLNSLHVVWNDKLNRWLVSASYVTHHSADVQYTSHYNEKPITFEQSAAIVSWVGRTITTAANILRQPGQRVIISPQRIVVAAATATLYDHISWPTGVWGTLTTYTQLGLISDGVVDFPALGVAPGDHVTFSGGDIQKPRRIVFVAVGVLLVEGTLRDPNAVSAGTDIPLVDTYTIRSYGRTVVTSGTLDVGSTASMLIDAAGGFIAAGVRPGMELILTNPAVPPIPFPNAVRVQIATVTATVLTFFPPLSGGAPVVGGTYTVRKQDNYFANIVSSTAVALTIDVDSTERLDPTTFVAANQRIQNIPREDVFLFSLGYNTPAVQVHDADGVYLENVDIGGWVDIEERYYNLARPVWRQGGTVIGHPDDGEVNSRAPADHLFLTPVGKVETVHLSNVRSRTKMKYGHPKVYRNGKP